MRVFVALLRVPLSPGMTTTLGPALNKSSSLTAVEVFGGKKKTLIKARKTNPLFVCRRTPSSWPQRGPIGTSKRRCFFAALDTTTNTRRPRPIIKTKAVATPPGEEEEELPDEVRDLKMQDIISLWVTQILQTYGDKPSSDNAPIVEGEIDDLVGGPIFLALYPYFRCVFSLFFSCGRPGFVRHAWTGPARSTREGAAERTTGDGCGSRTRFLSFIIFSNFRGRGETLGRATDACCSLLLCAYVCVLCHQNNTDAENTAAFLNSHSGRKCSWSSRIRWS